MATPSRPVAILTGASGGLGTAITKSLLCAGWDVMGVARGIEGLTRLLEMASSEGWPGVLEVIAADVSDPTEAARAIANGAAVGPLDVLVNAAGFAPSKPALNTSQSLFERCFKANVSSAFHASVAAAQNMRSGSSIIMVSSVLASRPLADRAAYSAAKAAVSQLTRSLALEWAPIGIAVNAVAPGMVLTSEVRRLLESDTAGVESLREATATGAMACPGDVGELIVSLARTPRSLVTGQIWTIDAGWSLQ